VRGWRVPDFESEANIMDYILEVSFWSNQSGISEFFPALAGLVGQIRENIFPTGQKCYTGNMAGQFSCLFIFRLRTEPEIRGEDSSILSVFLWGRGWSGRRKSNRGGR
jgi:hypothetical protein